jgi:hypothetical protein
VAWLVVRGYRAAQAESAANARRRTALAARADEQHAGVMAGDERGVSGAYPPAAY